MSGADWNERIASRSKGRYCKVRGSGICLSKPSRQRVDVLAIIRPCSSIPVRYMATTNQCCIACCSATLSVVRACTSKSRYACIVNDRCQVSPRPWKRYRSVAAESCRVVVRWCGVVRYAASTGVSAESDVYRLELLPNASATPRSPANAGAHFGWARRNASYLPSRFSTQAQQLIPQTASRPAGPWP